MSPQTRKRLWKSNFQHVSVHTAQTWGDHFLMELHETCASAQKHNTRHPLPLPLAEVSAAAAETQRRLIVLGYNAALKAVSVTKGPQIRFDRMQSGSNRTMCAPRPVASIRLARLSDLFHETRLPHSLCEAWGGFRVAFYERAHQSGPPRARRPTSSTTNVSN